MSVPERWTPFSVIEGSSVIFSFIIEVGYDNFFSFFEQRKNISEKNDIRISSYNELSTIISGLRYMFDQAELCDFKNLPDILNNPKKIELYYNFYTAELPSLKQEFFQAIREFTCHKEYVNKLSQTKFVKSQLYTYFMQEVGNNIRSSGTPYSNDYSEENFYNVAERIDGIIQIIKKYNSIHGKQNSRICIDAIRNPYEAYYFKDKYSSFYLVSINAEESDRRKRLGNLDEDELKSLDETEYEQMNRNDYDIFYHQNMQECLSVSDIHIYNPQSNDGKYHFLTEQIIKYICLMIHPGIINPTHLEHCMQTAYIARLNSGCLSRQVGAVITGDDYSVKAIGWNEVPEGQVPCNLRCVSDYCANKDIETYSSYELENKDFQDVLFAINSGIHDVDMSGMSYSYCFKDIYNGLTATKNQVFTRALHAEENSFLQLSKNGGQGIKGGKLFTTASPCELCAKKAFQLGIKDIYYIDPYPGISIQHILKFGTNFSPCMHLFYGAIGDAYMRLYTPRMPLKDELKLLTGINSKEVVNELQTGTSSSISVKDIKYVSQQCLFTFRTRTDVCETTDFEIEALRDGVKDYFQEAYWTGSSFNGFKIISCTREYSFNNIERIKLPYIGALTFNEPLKKEEKAHINMQVEAKDAQRIMSPYYAQLISIKTDVLIIGVQAPKETITDVKLVTYADINMSKEFVVDSIVLSPKITNSDELYSYTINMPNLLYGYCIEWSFVDK